MKHYETPNVSKPRFKRHPGLAWLVRRAGHQAADSGAPATFTFFVMTQHLAPSQPTAAASRTLRERLSQPGLITAPGVYDMVSLRLADTF